MDQILEMGFSKQKEGFRTEIGSCNPVLHLIWIKPALWVFLNVELGLIQKKQDNPDGIRRVDPVGYPEMWYLDHSDSNRCSFKKWHESKMIR